MKTVGLRLTREGANEQKGNDNEKCADPQQHNGRVAMTDLAPCRPVLPCYRCSSINQSPETLMNVLFV